MVYGNIEEALDLVSVQVAGHDSVDSGGCEEIGYEFRSDGYSRLVFSVLAGPSEIRHHCNDRIGGCSFGSVNGEKQLHQVLLRRKG